MGLRKLNHPYEWHCGQLVTQKQQIHCERFPENKPKVTRDAKLTKI